MSKSQKTSISVNGQVSCLRHPRKIEWVDQWNNLGITLRSGARFACSVNDRVKKLYRCANAILRIDGGSDDIVMLWLLETHCVPILTYAVEVIHVSNRDEKRQLRVAYNSIFRSFLAIVGHKASQPSNISSIVQLGKNSLKREETALFPEWKNVMFSRCPVLSCLDSHLHSLSYLCFLSSLFDTHIHTCLTLKLYLFCT